LIRGGNRFSSVQTECAQRNGHIDFGDGAGAALGAAAGLRSGTVSAWARRWPSNATGWQ
jgi:3-oxoacyl-[acyl-carrier-protein] synthase III